MLAGRERQPLFAAFVARLAFEHGDVAAAGPAVDAVGAGRGQAKRPSSVATSNWPGGRHVADARDAALVQASASGCRRAARLRVRSPHPGAVRWSRSALSARAPDSVATRSPVVKGWLRCAADPFARFGAVDPDLALELARRADAAGRVGVLARAAAAPSPSRPGRCRPAPARRAAARGNAESSSSWALLRDACARVASLNAAVSNAAPALADDASGVGETLGYDIGQSSAAGSSSGNSTLV